MCKVLPVDLSIWVHILSKFIPINMKLLDRVRTQIRRRNYSYKTEQSYVRWIVRYVKFHKLTHPNELEESDIVAFLNYLAVQRNVAGSTQNQAPCAIVFLYKQVLKEPVGKLNKLKELKNLNEYWLNCLKKRLTTLRITGVRIAVELATNERRNVKPRGGENWRGAYALMRGSVVQIR